MLDSTTIYTSPNACISDTALYIGDIKLIPHPAIYDQSWEVRLTYTIDLFTRIITMLNVKFYEWLIETQTDFVSDGILYIEFDHKEEIFDWLTARLSEYSILTYGSYCEITDYAQSEDFYVDTETKHFQISVSRLLNEHSPSYSKLMSSI